MNSDVIIIGGGAAGLTAALSASGCGAEHILILEAAPRAARKILASGNGRCNLANAGPLRYYGDGDFAQRVMRSCPRDRVLAFLQGLGLAVVEEEGGRIYPACGQAAAVWDVLREHLDRRGVALRCGMPVTRIEKTGGGFRVHAGGETFESPRVIAACGGMAGGNLGHDGVPYRLLQALGHTLTPPRPALTQLTAEKRAVKGLKGLRLPARLTLCAGDQPVSAAAGEVLFTDYGISGVCAMQLSRDAGELLEGGREAVLYLDFSPMLGLVPRVYDRVEAGDPQRNVPLVRACLQSRQRFLPAEGLLTGLLPRLLAEKMKGHSMDALARDLAAYRVPLTGVRGFEGAQVTRGGIACRDFCPETMESLLCPGLYAGGEMLNVDGDCGGYNLMFAFACGILAGAHAAKR